MFSTGFRCRSSHQFPLFTLAYALESAVRGLAIDYRFLWYAGLGISRDGGDGRWKMEDGRWKMEGMLMQVTRQHAQEEGHSGVALRGSRRPIKGARI